MYIYIYKSQNIEHQLFNHWFEKDVNYSEGIPKQSKKDTTIKI